MYLKGETAARARKRWTRAYRPGPEAAPGGVIDLADQPEEPQDIDFKDAAGGNRLVPRQRQDAVQAQGPQAEKISPQAVGVMILGGRVRDDVERAPEARLVERGEDVGRAQGGYPARALRDGDAGQREPRGHLVRAGGGRFQKGFEAAQTVPGLRDDLRQDEEGGLPRGAAAPGIQSCPQADPFHLGSRLLSQFRLLNDPILYHIRAAGRKRSHRIAWATVFGL